MNKVYPNLEVLILNKALHLKGLKFLNATALQFAFRAINLNGIWIADAVALPNRTKINLNIDLPISQNAIAAKAALAIHYLKAYADGIAQINLGLSAKYLLGQEWGQIRSEVEVAAATLGNFPYRFVLNLNVINSDDDILRIVNLIEQQGGKEIILGSLSSKEPGENILICANHVQKHTNLKVGVYGHFPQVGDLEAIAQIPFHSVLIPVSKLLEQSV